MQMLCLKMPKEVENSKDAEINPQNHNLNLFKTRKIYLLSNRHKSAECQRRTWVTVPIGRGGAIFDVLPKWKEKKETIWLILWQKNYPNGEL